ncbi:MAG: PilZ domain-containing protein [Acidobacteriota bacterium]
MSKKKVLIIGVDADTFGKLSPMLERSIFEVDRFPRGRASLDLVSVITFDALIVRYPLADMDTVDFLYEVRSRESENQRSPLLLVCRDEDEEAASALMGRGANRVVSISRSAARLQSEVSELLTVAPRTDLRVMANLQIQLEEGPSLAMCQTENISVSGMLLRTDEDYPKGTRFRFEFVLPSDERSVRGEAQVVRHTTVGRERVRGIGVRFLDFEGDGQDRFEEFIGQQTD